MDIRIRLSAFFGSQGKPSEHQEAEHGASRDDIHHLRNNEITGIAEYSDDGSRKQSVLTAKVKPEVQVLDDVPNGIDHDHKKQEAHRAKGPRIADECHAHGSQDGEPQSDDDPINQCRCEVHLRRSQDVTSSDLSTAVITFG
jgi:hypothetical protein